ncbi:MULTISPECIES: 5-methyltetrahydropteroyltriglutamate--homocysteine S-methyltransferase [Leuconostoc]|uniref:5-methyltetrahydropteroyltriglutamate--homocysteine S-methyltransferase n=1 Tax=Leuconostoc pseudomesenteroides TaxID=33968 RepID=A0A5B8T1L7_LEUPS|nr:MULTISPECIES: 5-methyltetrahydropteroyltriglutamate--homocysteine S-methyltransferase [Leuconostoc]MCC8440699.1 5-methyltetrahydropteroyltriglutamate--homocysteine S-methyltransferase [Leuconostoc pseudomesenteroides]MDG9734352.1 5-methyltetrahydropteroyltriglutamate--homocysteine S-methyltransferase [Leuconostoc pseudomesenteroides]MDN2451338.1 5-methyltetrahydropteroyltriglutamate--homocysteine S-methyltransferase [Leuconostoc sp. UCMA20149]NKZ36822.1 5-methyltetrahydropteroyltriglutamate-
MTTQTLQKIGFQHVGSFLRPEALKEARQSFAAGNITAEELEGVENAAITELVNKEVEAGLDVVTDGEFRRSYWHLDNFWGFDGVERFNYGEGYFFAHEETRDDSARLTGKLGFNADTHPFIQHFKFVKALADEAGVAAKITIPSPSQFYGELSRGVNVERIAEHYDSNEELFEDIKRVYHEEILALYNAGARTVQLDDCTWGLLVDPKFKDVYAATGFDINDLKRLYLDLNNGAIADLPDDLTINTHVCRGNYHSDWATSGGYDDVADELFGQENVTNYFLEYDSERAGGFAPLAKVSGDKQVVLGLITTKSGELEDKGTIIARIHEATKYLPLDRLWLSTQCGFASTEEGNILTDAQQWAKLQLVKEILDELWG